MFNYRSVRKPTRFTRPFPPTTKEQLTSPQGMRRLTGFLQIAQKLHRQELGKPWVWGPETGGNGEDWKTQPT